MLLATVKDEFMFHCQSRNLSPKTTKNYGRQIEYLFYYLAQEYQITHIEDVKPEYIKAFLLKMKPNHTPNYLNDLLKAYKVFFRYAFNEGYTDTLITAKIHNVKAPKVIIRTFTEAELKKMANYYTGYDVNRDNDTEVWEWVDIAPSTADIQMLENIADSQETIVRFQGDNYHYDLTIKSSDKAAIKDVLAAYNALDTIEGRK